VCVELEDGCCFVSGKGVVVVEQEWKMMPPKRRVPQPDFRTNKCLHGHGSMHHVASLAGWLLCQSEFVHWKQQGVRTQNGVTQNTMVLGKFLADSINSFPKHTGTALCIRYIPYINNNG
jgi:hypothetical protein